MAQHSGRPPGSEAAVDRDGWEELSRKSSMPCFADATGALWLSVDGPQLLEEVPHKVEPTLHEILVYAEWLGLGSCPDAEARRLAERALMAPLPNGWQAHGIPGSDVFFYNAAMGRGQMRRRTRDGILPGRGWAESDACGMSPSKPS